jgi:16S rRNA (cytosine1402-N4)-methyltransferase
MAKPEPAQRHRPVLRDRVVELLEPALVEPGSVCVDGTLGMGGHAEGILERCPEARLVGIDRDQQALDLAGQRLAPYADRLTLVHAVYDEFAAVVASLGLKAVDAALFDLGVSSLQLDEEDRGFAYRVDAPLDMRMDQSAGLTAAEVLNTYDVNDLTRILRDYGEERFARPIARAVVQDRDAEPFSTSGRLVELLRSVIPTASQRSGGHPAKRTYQALRIEVNRELDARETACRRRPDRRPQLPLAGGPDHQARPHRRRPVEHSGGAAGRAAGARRIPAAADPWRGGAEPGRGRREPAGRIRPAARGRAGAHQ